MTNQRRVNREDAKTRTKPAKKPSDERCADRGASPEPRIGNPTSSAIRNWAVLWLLAFSTVVLGQTSGPYEQQPIPTRHAVSPTTQGAVDRPASSPFQLSLTRVALSLGAVIAAILFLRWAARAVLGTGRTGGGSRAINVLARTTLAPRQQLMLIQLGRRIVLVSNCGTQMNALCEVSDPQEVAELLSLVRGGKSESADSAFAGLFGRESRKYQPTDVTVGEADASPPPAGSPAKESAEDAALAATREELAGLMGKVRSISSAIKREGREK